jgi:hypothetical protein
MEPRKSFDINAPSRFNPSANSRPVIVGHRPIMADPMMRPATPSTPAAAPPTHVAKVIEVTEEVKSDLAAAQPPLEPASADSTFPQAQQAAAATAEPGLQTAPPPGPEMNSVPTPTSAAVPQSAPTTEAPTPAQALPPVPQQDLSHIPHVAVSHKHHKGGGLKHMVLWVLIIGFLLVFAAYLLSDAGFIGGGTRLPFHIFNQAA